MSEMRQETLIVIPTYNEIENINDVLAKVFNLAVNVDVLIVDDNSPDKTADEVVKLQDKYKGLFLMRRQGKLGLGSAYIAGFKYALENGYQYICEMDADLSHDPNDIPRFLTAIKDADLVIGSRYISGVNVVNWPLSRLLLSYFASVYVRTITGIPIRDVTAGYKCYRRIVLETIQLDNISSQGYSFQVEMKWNAWRHGFRLKEIPIIFVDRTVGKSKMSKAIVREAILLVWKLFFRKLFTKKPSPRH